MRAEPFKIAIADADLDDLKRRLTNTRWADDYGNADWRYGVEESWLRDMITYWRDTYDWRAQEAAINRIPQFRVELDGIPIHFLHVRGKGPKPIPLILTHGWPWSFWDYARVIGPLSDPAAHGFEALDAFDLVIPSLPGYGFSTPLTKTGIDIPTIVRLWARLMTDVLGYDKFGAHGGDWGAAVTAHLGHMYPDHLIGIHQTVATFPGLDFTRLDPKAFAPDEQWMIARNTEMRNKTSSHIIVHIRDPQTLAYALVDSPVGTAAWLWERRRAWSDCNGDVLSVFDRDSLCTLASIYWLNKSITTSMRLYAEQFRNTTAFAPIHDRKPVIEVPTGYAIYPKDNVLIPRSLAAANTNLKRWTVLEKGGHFGAGELPVETAFEIREFFRPLRS